MIKTIKILGMRAQVERSPRGYVIVSCNGNSCSVEMGAGKKVALVDDVAAWEAEMDRVEAAAVEACRAANRRG